MTSDDRWQQAADDPDHRLAPLDGAGLVGGVSLDVRLGPRSSVGSTYFRCYLATADGRTVSPVVFGLQNDGAYPGFNWVEVLDYFASVPLDGGGTFEVTAGVERALFERLASIVPPGGHFMAEYDSVARSLTARALSARVPPVATPLGALLFEVGCGVAFRDWYISEGGREGPRKLQGFRALDDDHARTRGLEAADALDAFLAERGGLSTDLREVTFPLAESVLGELRRRFGGS
ncbi:MAG: DUF1122 domain-containing protein [Chloroflexi bacterium]|nr:DUF1122 domain-containing protein [Chloroflexota bacterium]